MHPTINNPSEAVTEIRRLQLLHGLTKQIPGHPDYEVARTRTPLQCVYEGRPHQPPEGRDARKMWFQCDAGKGVVCKCANCGCVCNESCDKYVADTDEI